MYDAFKIEQRSNKHIAIYRVLNDIESSSELLCTASEREILFGKGVIVVSHIDKLFERHVSNGKKIYTIYVNENKKWNENIKKNHPIRWRLRLISRSKPFIYSLGVAARKKDEELLKSFFQDIGVRVESEQPH